MTSQAGRPWACDANYAPAPNSSSDVVSANLRFRWEYRPGSELFVVYTEERDTETLMPDRFSELRNRGFVVKMNRLFRF